MPDCRCADPCREIRDAPCRILSHVGIVRPAVPAGVCALAGLWPPWRRRGATTRTRPTATSVTEPPTVRLIQPQVRNIVRVVGQPSFIQSYERSSVYPKMNAYIQKWIVDIGDKVKKGDVLATLFVPELVEDHRDEEGDGRARPGADRAGQGGGGGGRGRRRGGRGAARGSPGGTRRLPGRGRALGLGGQAARERAQEGRGQSPGCPPDHQSVEGVRRRAGHGGGDRPEGGRRAALPAGRAIQGRGRRQGRRSRPESGRERGEAAPGLGGLPRTARAV